MVESFTLFQLVIIFLLFYTSLYMLVDRICKCFETCGKAKAVAKSIRDPSIGDILRKQNDGNNTVRSPKESNRESE